MTDGFKELFNYGVLGIFAAFVLWSVVKGCRAVYEVLFSPGNPEKGIPKGLIVRVVDYLQTHLERIDTTLDRTAGVMERNEEQLESQRGLCRVHTENMEAVTILLTEQKGNTGRIAESLQRLVDIHESPNGGTYTERTHRKLCAVQKSMVEYCIMCKKLAAKSSDPSILEIVVEHCDAIIKAVSADKETEDDVERITGKIRQGSR